MTDDQRARDAEVAEKIMGWRWFRLDPKEWPNHPYLHVRSLRPPDNGVWTVPANGDEIPHRDMSIVPEFSTDIAAAQAMEAELQRQGRHGQYAEILSGTLLAQLTPELLRFGYSAALAWSLLRATPAQRVEAGLQTIGDTDGSR